MKEKIVKVALAAMLLLSLCGCGGSKTISIPDNELGNRVPAELPSKYGEIVSDYTSVLHLRCEKISSDQFKQYQKVCEKAGYTIDVESDSLKYSAFDEDGYSITLMYYEKDKQLDIIIDESIEKKFTTLAWPKSQIASRVPLPKSTVGYISWENDNGFVLRVGETSREDFSAYADICYDSGFNTDYRRGDAYFYAYNAYGDGLSVKYEGNMTMFIRIDAGENQTEEPITSPNPEESSIAPSVSPSETPTPKQTQLPSSNPTISKAPEETLSPAAFTTNDYTTAGNGNSGVFAYIKRGSSYNLYYIIDFDEGYVYYFREPDSNTCDRIKIESGDLNSGLAIIYHDGADNWTEYLHFKWEHIPDTLIMRDADGFEYQYSKTSLMEALAIRNTKTIKDY